MRALTTPHTYVYTRKDGIRCHQQWCGPYSGDETEHPDDPNWTPPDDWPYEWTDLDDKE